MKTIYLDTAASTSVKNEVVKVMERYFLHDYGNPSSPHSMGERARSAVEEARKSIAQEIGAKPWEIIFTSGATESNNLAILGLKKKTIISAIEHASVYEPARILNAVQIPVNHEGLIDMKKLEQSLHKGMLVSIIHTHNELGVMQDLREIGMLCKKKGALFHTDAVQSFGKAPLQVKTMGIDMLSASAHKIGGPKGIGLLYVREGVSLTPLMYGGGQERGLRSGTENVPGIVGFAAALKLMKKVDTRKIKNLRDYFMEQLEPLGGFINGSKEKRIYNNVHVSIPLDAAKAVLYLSQKGIMCSTGSACDTKTEDKRALQALGINDTEIKSALRFTLNEDITKKDINYVIKILKEMP
ncbi:cysteine desulfurase [Candidatus Pacearchaeota archaeon]|nr:cysteine desulfurase [Candidatus Pacearchaeota archaeon]